MQRTPPSAAVARTRESVFCCSLNVLPLAIYIFTPLAGANGVCPYLVPGRISRPVEIFWRAPKFPAARRPERREKELF
jgi:hypothetical protein